LIKACKLVVDPITGFFIFGSIINVGMAIHLSIFFLKYNAPVKTFC